jgi:hypothetical protein
MANGARLFLCSLICDEARHAPMIVRPHLDYRMLLKVLPSFLLCGFPVGLCDKNHGYDHAVPTIVVTV